MLPEEDVAASPFQQLCCSADAQRVRNADDSVQVVRHHLQFVDLDVVFRSSLPEAGFSKVFILLLPKHPIAVLLAPFDLPEVVAY